VRSNKGGVVPKANAFPKRPERGEGEVLIELGPARPVGDDVERGPKILGGPSVG
jgi:hypothetical protein